MDMFKIDGEEDKHCLKCPDIISYKSVGKESVFLFKIFIITSEEGYGIKFIIDLSLDFEVVILDLYSVFLQTMDVGVLEVCYI